MDRASYRVLFEYSVRQESLLANILLYKCCKVVKREVYLNELFIFTKNRFLKAKNGVVHRVGVRRLGSIRH